MSDNNESRRISKDLERFLINSEENLVDSLKLDVSNLTETQNKFLAFQIKDYTSKNISSISNDTLRQVVDSSYINKDGFFQLRKSIVKRVSDEKNVLDVFDKLNLKKLKIDKNNKEYSIYLNLVAKLIIADDVKKIKDIYDNSPYMEPAVKEILKKDILGVRNKKRLNANLIEFAPELAVLYGQMSTEELSECFAKNMDKKSFVDFFRKDFDNIFKICSNDIKAKIFFDFFYEKLKEDLKKTDFQRISIKFENVTLQKVDESTLRDYLEVKQYSNIWKLCKNLYTTGILFLNEMTSRLYNEKEYDLLSNLLSINIKQKNMASSYMSENEFNVDYDLNLAQLITSKNNVLKISKTEFFNNHIIKPMIRECNFYTKEISFSEYCFDKPTSGLIYLRGMYREGLLSEEDKKMYIGNLAHSFMNASIGSIDKELRIAYLNDISSLHKEDMRVILPKIIERFKADPKNSILSDLNALQLYCTLDQNLSTTESAKNKFKV